MKKLPLFLIFCFILAMPGKNAAQMSANTKPKVLILTTGGTIASRTSAPMVEGPALVQAVPQLLNYAQIEVKEFSRIGSSQMTPAHWLRLSKDILLSIEQQPDLCAIVITHGTDSMEETAFFLNLTIRSKVPIILAGSMRSSNEISADGPANLLNAVRVGVSKQAIGKGVLVVLDESIGAARDVIKMHNRRVGTFQSPGLGFLGYVEPDTITFYREPLKPHTLASEFDISQTEKMPKVELVKDFTGFDPDILKYFFKKEIDGLVLESFAGGRVSAGVYEGLKQYNGKGIPVVIASGIKGGRISGRPHYEFPVVFAHDLPANKARILLMLALSHGAKKKNLQGYFDKY